ncbi:MAG: hypothetical protein JXR70_03145 [Spirochaetales bacterium]|nr:hypothetical protein [Spirochaetales bacterium]
MKLSRIEFQNHQAVEIKTKGLEVKIIIDCGPRLCYLGKPGGENLLLWKEKTYTRKKWDLMGGHRVWVSRPLADENEETYQLQNEPCEVKQLEDGWEILTPINPEFETQKGLRVRVLADDKLEVDNYLINRGKMLYSGGVWALTCTVPGKKTLYAIPLGADNMWDYCKVVMFRSWETHSGAYNDDQFSYTEDMMLLQSKGRENKRMIQADRGIMAMNDPERNIMFAKKVDYIRSLQYPQDCNLAVYTGPDSFMVEMETMGPEETVKPGETIHNVETWVLKDALKDLTVKALENCF